ncbi:MAG: dockerin type I repeat-containing protein [Oscillospiraceae bacterium]|nr:dockerin type I repeat-containing protein [Oscillospiraceae bacterium]
MKKKLLAILSAAVMCLSAVPIAGTAVSAEENAGDILPDWVPESFSEALEFENTYGATHIEDGVVCLLFSETTNESYSYEISATTDVMTEVSRNTYTEDLADFKYEVVVYKPFANGSFEVDLNRKFQTATFVDYSFDFYVDEDGTISETDIYSWVPDCITEYNDFAEKNGTVSVHGGYIAYYYTVGGGTGNSLIMEQNGTAEIKQIAESDCTEKVAYTEVCGTPTYSVVVYQPVSDGTVDISWKIGYEWDLENSTISEINKSYEVSENGTVITEIQAAPDENTQRVSVVDYETEKLLQFSDAKLYPVSFHTGYEIEYVLIDGSFGWSTNWGPTSEWDYNGQNPFVIDIADFAGGFGVAEYEVINIDLPRGYYLPDDYLEVKEYDNNSADIYIKVKKTVNGDINADETFSVADAVLLQKWQVNAADTKLSNWRNADLNGDEKLDVFDSCMMRRELIEQNQSDTKPVLMIEDYQITMSENGWDSQNYERIITQNGTRYTAESVVIDPVEGYEWKLEDDINYIMNSGTEELFIKDSDILQKISDFTESAAQYKDCEMESWNFSIDDWGQEVLYALYTDENGSYQMIELCRLGGECAWLDNAEVQEFVTMLIENGYFGDKGILSYYFENQ